MPSRTRGLLVVASLAAACVCVTGSPTAAQTVADRFTLPSTDEGVPGAGPLRRDDWFRELWRQRRTLFASSAARDRGAVVFLGDSITQGWEAQLATAFAGAKVVNRGINGDTTRGVLLRLEEDVLSLDPAAVVLLIGINDVGEGATPEVVTGNLTLILDAITKHSDRTPVVLCEVMPSAVGVQGTVKSLNARYRAAAKGRPQVTVLDTWTLFADAEGGAPKALFPDLLHPNDAGYEKWAAALRPVLATLGFLETADDAFTPEPGFETLFNGRDLTGWGFRPTTDADRESARKWQASDPNAAAWPFVDAPVSFDGQAATPDGRYRALHGRLVVTTPTEGRRIQQLWTAKEFGDDFTLRLEFRATPNADSGVFIRGQQLQCRDYCLAGPYKDLKAYKPQDWNVLEVVVAGGVARATCNGELLEEAMKVPMTGSIGLEGDRGQMEYRRIRIRHGK